MVHEEEEVLLINNIVSRGLLYLFLEKQTTKQKYFYAIHSSIIRAEKECPLSIS